ncbi:type II toxin-antitoxin system Phd/YefM family antitoxin [Pseudomonas moraviensis]|uniref:Antitoxin n=1 Tax=Pseudomonas moraviensis TaxID=321662 RepID=A0A7Y9VZE7_9PSED|nr:type II toxin-antitoxin system prevent-host-death family antitoxin [Pseudomonas moraviensis]NYH11087.1 prevent-host-death family protein [Pseudomonas moraviensis]
MKREIFFELVSSFDSSVVERRSKVMQFPYIARHAGLSLTCTEKIRDFAGPLDSGYICPEYEEDMMIIVPLAEAKNNLSRLVDEAASGQIITIAKHGRALARLVPVTKAHGPRIGAMKGKLVLPENFDAPLPDDMLDAFEGGQS